MGRRASLSVLALALASACPGSDEPGGLSAVLITLDTTRDDAVGAPGVTPHLDALARDGVRFERAYTVAPLTLPAHASMLTGLVPLRHGLRVNGAGALPLAASTLAEHAAAAGLRTGAIIGAVVLDGAFGLDQGFETYDVPPHGRQQRDTHFAMRTGAEVVELALAWLDEGDPRAPFFLWVHLWDPHAPYDAPAELAGRFPEHPYLDEVAAADAAVGTLIAGLTARGLMERTAILVVGDHGEAFGEHGELTHGTYCATRPRCTYR